MNFARIIALGWLAAAPALAQSGAAAGQLEAARKELRETSSEYSAMRGALYREINSLDDEALKLGKELRELERQESLRIQKERTTRQNTQILQANFDFASGVLRNYGENLVNRMHVAENQLYEEELDQLAEEALAAKEDPLKEMEVRLKAVEKGLERIDEVAGGRRFEGKAMRNGTEAREGSLLVLGPAVYFHDADGSFEGVATFSEGGTGLPTVVAIESVDSGRITEAVSSGQGTLPFDPTLGKALKVEAARESLGDVVAKGGIVGHAILLLGAVAIGLTLFKVWEISKFPVPSRRRINEIIDDLVNDDHESAKRRASGLEGMAGDLVKTGVERFYEKRRVLEEALYEKLVAIKPRLERFLPFLGLVAAAAPLMGLLGTVLGIIKTFKAMALDSGNKQAFTVGISEALITTAEGLVVAIPVLVLHGLMKSLAKGKFSEIEAIGISLINGTTELERGAPRPRPGRDDEGGDDDSELVPNPA